MVYTGRWTAIVPCQYSATRRRCASFERSHRGANVLYRGKTV